MAPLSSSINPKLYKHFLTLYKILPLVMGVGKIFSRVGAVSDFSRGRRKLFFRGGQQRWNFILPTPKLR